MPRISATCSAVYVRCPIPLQALIEVIWYSFLRLVLHRCALNLLSTLLIGEQVSSLYLMQYQGVNVANVYVIGVTRRIFLEIDFPEFKKVLRKMLRAAASFTAS